MTLGDPVTDTFTRGDGPFAQTLFVVAVWVGLYVGYRLLRKKKRRSR